MQPEPLPSGPPSPVLLGVDLGGTKIEAAILSEDGRLLNSRRIANPGNYEQLLLDVRDLCDPLATGDVPLGMGIPGSISPTTGLVRNCNSTFINGKDLAGDLAEATGRRVRLANDANCFALSEALDGAGAGFRSVFGVIIGTGVGGGIVIDGALVDGATGVAGEWGHIPLPWAAPFEHLDERCWCGQYDCMELWASGPAFERDYGGAGIKGLEIVARAKAGEPAAVAALDRYVSRLGRGLALICNLLDPAAIVLGGGMSNIEALYAALPAAMQPFLFNHQPAVRVLRHRHGDSSGVRGAAWLWRP